MSTAPDAGPGSLGLRPEQRRVRPQHWAASCERFQLLPKRQPLGRAANWSRAWLLAGLLLILPACRPAVDTAQTPDSAPAAPAPPAAKPADPPAVDPLDADAERVLAAMPATWQAMLAKAEEFDRRERVGWCITCHINVQDELAKRKHEKGDVSCVECHGASERHARDENNDIKPDEVFARKDVDRVCGDCHACSRPASTTPAPTPPPVCTDCHPAHTFVSTKAAPATSDQAPPQSSATQ